MYAAASLADGDEDKWSFLLKLAALCEYTFSKGSVTNTDLDARVVEVVAAIEAQVNSKHDEGTDLHPGTFLKAIVDLAKVDKTNFPALSAVLEVGVHCVWCLRPITVH